MVEPQKTISLVFAAGKGSRMQGFEGNKTLLPLVPSGTPFQGKQPILRQILQTLPAGAKAVVIHHRKEEVIRSTHDLGVTYYVQPELNGTGGALLCAREFMEKNPGHRLIITMGDVPFVKASTYQRLAEALDRYHFMALGFVPVDKRQYGILEVKGDQVKKITEWKYWRAYPDATQRTMGICNSGIYAARVTSLTPYIDLLAKNPHRVLKEREGRTVEIEEFFITDLVEWMDRDALRVGYMLAGDEKEVMGIDDLPSLVRAQDLYRKSQPRTQDL